MRKDRYDRNVLSMSGLTLGVMLRVRPPCREEQEPRVERLQVVEHLVNAVADQCLCRSGRWR